MKKFLLVFCLLLIWQQAYSQGQLYIKVGEANVKKSLLAVPPFVFVGSPALVKNYKQVGQDLYNVFYNDLDVSSYFQFINQAAYLEDVASVGLRPKPGEPGGFDFANWSKIGAEFLVRTGFKVDGGDIVVDAYVYHVPQAKAILTKSYRGKLNEVRYVAHTYADDFIKALTGQKGWFRSKIAFISDKDGNRWKEVYVSDWDTFGVKKITNHRSITVSPAWSPDGKTVLYTAMSYHKQAKTNNHDLYSYEIYTGKRFLISWYKGINTGASFDPSGKFIYLTISQDGSPDLYRMTPDGKERTRLTNGPLNALNVEPAVSPDGKQIAFSSNRSGQPMIYIMNTDGTNVRRLTIAGKYNATPTWSPDGKRIAFSGWDSSHFDIFTMNPDGTRMERLTDAPKKNGKPSNNESPSFSPDGRQLLFISDRTGSKQIFMVNADGTRERRVTFDNYNYNSPRWLWKIPD